MRRLLVLAAVLAGCTSDPPAPPLDRAALQADWQAWVDSRDSLFRSPGSPFLPDDREAYRGVPYFAYDSTLAVPAVLVPSLAGDTVIFPTTTGELQRFAQSGHLVFEAGGVQRRLEAFQSVGTSEPSLFVPFRDATTGSETYGGGRYLTLEPVPSGRYALDFNRAYHPYCVYNPSYSCPLPPAENTLETPITAGERLP